MANKKEQREPVNPKWLLREIMKSLPKVDYVRSTVCALWAHCDSYIEKDDVEGGIVSFSGTISYSQLAEFCACGNSTAKWRMSQMRDKFELVEWEVIRRGIKFTFGSVLVANGLATIDPANGLATTDYDDVLVANDSSLVANSDAVVANGDVQVANGLAPLAFDLALSGEKLSGSRKQEDIRFAQDEQHQQQQQPRSSASQIDEDDSPSVPAHSPAPQARVIPPAAPKTPVELRALWHDKTTGPDGYYWPPAKPDTNGHRWDKGKCFYCKTHLTNWERKGKPACASLGEEIAKSVTSGMED